MNKSEFYHDKTCGLSNVFIKGIKKTVDVMGDVVITFPKPMTLHKKLLSMVLEKDSTLNGEEIKFLRTELGFNQNQLAELFGNDIKTIQRWESEKTPFPIFADVLLRELVAEKIGDIATIKSGAWTLINKVKSIPIPDHKYIIEHDNLVA